MKITNYVAFDIETEALDREWIISLTKPFKPFIPARVKTGDCRTPENAAAKVALAKAKHEAEEQTYFDHAVERGALTPETGRVLSVGFWDPHDKPQLLLPHVFQPSNPDEIERRMIEAFWARWQGIMENQGLLLSWNGAGFDLPFLIRRSWILGVSIPRWVRRGKFFHDSHIDLMQTWVGHVPNQFIKLDLASRVLKIGSKCDQEVSGGQFAIYYRAGGEKRDMAIKYALRDLELTCRVGEIMLGI